MPAAVVTVTGHISSFVLNTLPMIVDQCCNSKFCPAFCYSHSHDYDQINKLVNICVQHHKAVHSFRGAIGYRL